MSINKNVAVFVGLALALAVVGMASPVSAAALTQAQVDAIIGLLQSFGADQSTINNVQASLTGGTPAVTPGGSYSYVFNNNLTMGSTGTDVKNLQRVLNSDADTMVAASGVGSPGNESSYFGALTRAAAIKFQKKYGITPAVGYVGAITRAKLNTMGGVVVVPPPGVTPPVVPAGTGLTVSAAAQPPAMLFPLSAARVPFTKINFTAGSDGAVTVNSLVVQRGGPSTDADVASIVLLDENGNQVGLSKTLNSAHQATLSEAFVVSAGQTRTMTLAANRPSADADSSGAGAVFTLSLVAVNTSATVSGSLPIVGTAQTGNSGLTIGSITNARGPLDPAAQAGGVSKNVGTTGYTFSSIKVTAGSVEDVLIKSIRWNQASSAASTDLANVVTVVDGVSYPAVIDSTGKYYTSAFADGIKVEKGLSKEISVKGDIVSGSGRTIAFNIEKTTDLNVTGLTLGYGITPPTSGTGFSTGTIWYPGSTISINAGSITVSADSSVAAQNIAINVANQPLGGFSVEVKGEPISVASTAFRLSNGSRGLTNITLVNQNGAVLAGPVDAASGGAVTFTDTITYPVGVTKLQLKGKLDTTWSNNGTASASTTPSTNWTTITGQVTGTTITASPSSAITANSMTVKTAALTISILPDPVAQTVVAGGQNFTFTKYQLDAGASGEDLRISSLALYLTSGTSAQATELTNCVLYDSSTALNTGSNAVNPSLGAPTDSTFTFDTALVIPKGTSKTLALKCNIAAGGTTTHKWGINTAPTVTGATSGQSATVTTNTGTGPLMTLTSGGSMSVTLDSSSPSYKVVAAGTTGNTVSVLRFHATNEDMTLQSIALQLSSTTASTNADASQVTLWDGATQIGSAIFDGTTVSSVYLATSTLTTNVVIPKDGDKLITVKVDLPNQGSSYGGHPGALVAVDWDGGATIGTKALGASSGTAVYATGTDTAASGLRVFKSYPTITYPTATTGSLIDAGVSEVMPLTVTADAKGDVYLRKLTFSMSTSTASLTGTSITFNGPVGNVHATSTLDIVPAASGPTTVYVTFDSTSNTSDRIVSAGSSKVYSMKATVDATGTSNAGSVNVLLKADVGYPSLTGSAATPAAAFFSQWSSLMATSTYGSIANSNIIWSPMSTTSSVAAGATGNNDWTNGYGLPGCFSALGQDCVARTTKTN